MWSNSRAYRPRGIGPSGGDAAAFEVLVRRAVVAVRKRRALARLALARRCAAAGDAAVERAGLDLLLDEADGCADALRHRPRDLCLDGDREIASDVAEERSIRLGEVVRIGGEALHRPLARREHLAAVLEARVRVCIGVDEIANRAVDRPGVLIHAVLDVQNPLVHRRRVFSFELERWPLRRRPLVHMLQRSDATREHSTRSPGLLQMFSEMKTAIGRFGGNTRPRNPLRGPLRRRNRRPPWSRRYPRRPRNNLVAGSRSGWNRGFRPVRAPSPPSTPCRAPPGGRSSSGTRRGRSSTRLRSSAR